MEESIGLANRIRDLSKETLTSKEYVARAITGKLCR